MRTSHIERVSATKAIVCIDDQGGMLFNHRRQSSDRILRAKILQLTAGSRLLCNAYTAAQFSENSEKPNLVVSDDFLNRAQPGDFCFVEDQPLASVVERLEEIILFKWNRVYPADTYFDISLDDWRCVSAIDFAGSSHETITQEVYCR